MERPFSKATIELSHDDLKKVNKAKVGGKIRVVIRGTVKEIHAAQTDASDQAGADQGSVVLDVKSMDVVQNNEIAELFEDELDG